MRAREGVMRGGRSVGTLKSPVLVAAFQRSPFGNVGQLSPDAFDLAQCPLTKIVIGRFQHHFRTIPANRYIFRNVD
jgi:hypothetical protein